MDWLIAVCLAALLPNFYIVRGTHVQGASGNSITSVANVSIECKTERYGVVFKFTDQKSTDTVRIAECQFGPGGHSQLMNASFRDTYNVTLRDSTCILTILYLTEEQCGIYTCSEMYAETQTIKFSITCKDVPSITGQTESHSTIVVCLTVGCVVLGGVCIIFGVCFYINRKKNRNESKGSTEVESLLTPLGVRPNDQLHNTEETSAASTCNQDGHNDVNQERRERDGNMTGLGHQRLGSNFPEQEKRKLEKLFDEEPLWIGETSSQGEPNDHLHNTDNESKEDNSGQGELNAHGSNEEEDSAAYTCYQDGGPPRNDVNQERREREVNMTGLGHQSLVSNFPEQEKRKLEKLFDEESLWIGETSSQGEPNDHLHNTYNESKEDNSGQGELNAHGNNEEEDSAASTCYQDGGPPRNDVNQERHTSTLQ